VALLAAGIVVGLAGPALAHHPEVSGSVACSDGSHVITWKVGNSETTSGSGRTMTVDQIFVSSGTVAGIAVGTAFPPKPQTGSTRTATTTLGGAQTGSVTLTVRADWNRNGPQNQTRTATVTLRGNCVPVTTTTTAPSPTTTTTQPPPTTTTTQPPATTTTTTQPPTTTTTTQPPTTTTTQPPTTTTTQPPTTTTTTTTAAPATTTTSVPIEILGAQVTRGAAPTQVAPTELARTGLALGGVLIAGEGLYLAGRLLRRFRRRS
jgi:hypothetical protein